MTSKKYDANIDYNFFLQHDVTVTELLPWQFRLEHPDIVGRFMWYPEGGSLIYEKPEWGVSKLGEYTNTEDVYAKMIEKTT